MKILHTFCGKEKEPLLRAFGFKGNALTCLWQVAVYLKTEETEAVGLGIQSVLWSDAAVFGRYGEEAGNSLMLQTTRYALCLLRGRAVEYPPKLLEAVFPEIYNYAVSLTGMQHLSQTFVRNALVPVDMALWRLWLETQPDKNFDRIWDIPHTKQSCLANIPLITYGTGEDEILSLAREGTPLLKIKIGSDPKGNGSAADMLAWDQQRLLQIHRLIKDIPTAHTETGRIMYYLDANGRYDSKDTVLRLLDFLRQHDILERVILLEEPFPEEKHIFVGDLPVCVAADESVHDMQQLLLRCELGYGALTLKPIAKGLGLSLEMARFALDKGMYCFCADLTVNPVMVTWNQNVAARLPKLPGMRVGVVESNGRQNYTNWQQMQIYHPAVGSLWLTPEKGIYKLDEEFFNGSGGIFAPAPYYQNLALREVSDIGK